VWLAVVSQPFDRGCKVCAPGQVDTDLKEFWVENPWDIPSQGHNLSAFERKRLFLNVQGQDFLDVSHLSGADNKGDGRSVVAADFRNCGRLDLLVRQAGGGPLHLYENRFPPRHYLEVTLRGRTSNRQGVGARLEATAGALRQVREMYPHNTYRSQTPNRVHFGLADAATVDRLVVRWPSGKVQEFDKVPADRHVVIDEGTDGPGALQTAVPGRTIAP
jgi:hypothetical protein